MPINRMTPYFEDDEPQDDAPTMFQGMACSPAGVEAMYHTMRRDFSPLPGRWTTTDPLGCVEGSTAYSFPSDDDRT